MDRDERDMRVEALRLAAGLTGPGSTNDEIVARAQAFFAFLTGRGAAQLNV